MKQFILIELLRSHPLFKTYQENIKSILIESVKAPEPDAWFVESLQLKLPFFYDFLKKHEKYQNHRLEKLILLKEKNFSFICYGSVNYPEAFYRMSDPPWCLSIKGVAPYPWENHKGLAIVGSRDPREESLIWMEQQLGLFLHQKAIFTVSGGARGVDQRAHKISIRSLTPTVVVVPSGLSNMYPKSLNGWEDDIVNSGGCLISEYPMEMPMQKRFFSDRNRLIAALASTVLIVEAKEKSGTMLTANAAAEMGRPLMVVPGHPVDPQFRGSLNLLSEGAILVRDAEDLSLVFEVESWGVENTALPIVAGSTINH